MRAKKTLLLLAAAVTIGACGWARAELFDFSYTTTILGSASGTLTATLQSGNTYLITGITGTQSSGGAITGLGSSYPSDNLLYFPAGLDNPQGNFLLDSQGFSFLTAGGAPTFQETYVRLFAGQYEVTNGFDSDNATSFDVTEAPAPIPGAGALSYLVVLFGGLATFRRRALASAKALLVAAAPAWFTRRQCPGSQNGYRA